MNYCKLLPVEDYFPGVELPPHLSPFVQEEEGDYIPPERQAMLEEQRKADGIEEKEEDQKGKGLMSLSCRALAAFLRCCLQLTEGNVCALGFLGSCTFPWGAFGRELVRHKITS